MEAFREKKTLVCVISWPAESIYYSWPGPISSLRGLPTAHNKTPNNLFIFGIFVFLDLLYFLRAVNYSSHNKTQNNFSISG